MSLEKAEKFLEDKGYGDRIILIDAPTATVAMAAEELVGHAPGGVCPFGINPGIDIYLDESLKRYERVFPAAGNDHSAVNLTISELEDASGAAGWVDVCKEPEK